MSFKKHYETNYLKTTVPRKNKEGYLISFDYITFVKVNFNQRHFVSDRTTGTTMQFSKMQNERATCI